MMKNNIFKHKIVYRKLSILTKMCKIYQISTQKSFFLWFYQISEPQSMRKNKWNLFLCQYHIQINTRILILFLMAQTFPVYVCLRLWRIETWHYVRCLVSFSLSILCQMSIPLVLMYIWGNDNCYYTRWCSCVIIIVNACIRP